MAELEVGDTRQLSVDVGPVITAEARDAIQAPCRGDARARTCGDAGAAAGEAAQGNLRRARADRGRDKIADVEREVFGPVLHVLRYRRDGLDRADRFDQRRRLRPHLRPAYAHRRDDRARHRADRSRQHLCQPQHHRRDGRRAAVRRLAALGHRAEGGRPALSVAARLGAAAGRARRARRRGRRARRAAPLHPLARRRGPSRPRPSAASASWRARRSARGSSFPVRSASATSMRCGGAAGSPRSPRPRAGF